MTTQERIFEIIDQLKQDPEATDLLYSYAAALEIRHMIEADAVHSHSNCS